MFILCYSFLFRWITIPCKVKLTTGSNSKTEQPVTSGSEWVRTSENESRVSRDLASAYVLCLHTFVVPNLQRDEGKSLGK